jgi:protocatechuate 3,4-dioxygenase beta subunit
VPGPASGLGPEWRGGTTTRVLSSPVTVSDSGPPLTGIDEHMATPSSVSGVVQDQSAQPVVGATVRAYLVGMSGYLPSATVTTGADGSYTFDRLLPGDYQIVFIPSGPFAAAEWYDDSPTREGATTLVLTGGPVTGIDAQLAIAGAISGNAGGSGVIVSAYAPSDTWVGGHQVVSAADGSYTLAGLAPGTYKIAFFPPVGAASWYGGATRTAATSLVVVGGSTVTGIDR